ncbi:hypothetical protein K501DRAFT_288724 [Backusella circina FSU 941]|nr:hypothetical protein K501DRAFT_288724 [Backusella circina FSU 941]
MHTTCLMLLVIPSPTIAETATTIYGFSCIQDANLSLHFAKVPPMLISLSTNPYC